MFGYFDTVDSVSSFNWEDAEAVFSPSKLAMLGSLLLPAGSSFSGCWNNEFRWGWTGFLGFPPRPGLLSLDKASATDCSNMALPPAELFNVFEGVGGINMELVLETLMEFQLEMLFALSSSCLFESLSKSIASMLLLSVASICLYGVSSTSTQCQYTPLVVLQSHTTISRGRLCKISRKKRLWSSEFHPWLAR